MIKGKTNLRNLASPNLKRPKADGDGAISVVDRLKKLIHREGLRLGMKLPPEREVAARLSVGRPAVREAIKALSSLDVLESRRGDGTYLKSLSALSDDAGPVVIRTSRVDLIELLELRKMIEPRAAALAAARATPAQIRRIEGELRAQERVAADLEVFAAHDYQFHHEILAAAGNRLLVKVEESLAPLLRKSRAITIHTTPSIDVVCQQHRTIFNAIRLGESQLAERAMFDHLQSMGVDLISGVRR